MLNHKKKIITNDIPKPFIKLNIKTIWAEALARGEGDKGIENLDFL